MQLGIRSPLRYYTPGSSPLLDDFNRADQSPIGGNWTNDLYFTGDMRIVSNQLAGVGVLGDCYWNPATFGPNCEVRAVAAVVAGAIDMWIRAIPDPGAVDGYRAWIVGAEGGFFRHDNNVSTQLGANIPMSPANNDAYVWAMFGSVMTLYKNGAVVDSRTDTTYTAAGRVALGSESSSSRWDNFGAGSL